jgi:hypothetical protein
MNRYVVNFRTQPIITRVTLATGQPVIVVDDVLDAPERLIDLVERVKGEFVPALDGAFPGAQLLMDNDFSAKLDDFFRLHIREHLGGRRSLQMISRLSRVTALPEELDGRQRICHRDNAGLDARHLIAASVLYLFQNQDLGGTVFFRPLGSSAETEALVADASLLDAHQFGDKYGWPASYPTQSNRYFEVIGRVPAKWNRIIFYDGGIFHSSDTANPELLNAPQSGGRLTVNGFFTCTRKAI